MSKRKVGRPSSYRAYVKEYNLIKKEMKKRGYDMAEVKYTKAEWERAHFAEKNERKEAILKGERKTIGNINRDLIKRQQWKYSSAQAKAQRKAYTIAGGKEKDIKISDIRSGKTQAVDWNAIANREKELRAQGLGWNRVHTKISEEFFGS